MVFCRDCSGYRTDGRCYTGEIQATFHSGNVRIRVSPLYQNMNNNCEHYRRKWWKFWVKEVSE